jgi:hypothetical protein
MNTNDLKLPQKFYDETLYNMCSLSKIVSEEFEHKLHEITTEIL